MRNWLEPGAQYGRRLERGGWDEATGGGGEAGVKIAKSKEPTLRIITV